MPPVILSILYCNTWQEETHLFFWGARIANIFLFLSTKKYLATEVLKKQGYKDSNLELTESESVALPFGDSYVFCFSLALSLAMDVII